MNTDRIKQLAKKQSKTVTYICKLIDRPKYYLNDVPLSANTNPISYGEPYSFKQEDTPYHNGRECPFLFFARIAVGFSALQRTQDHFILSQCPLLHLI